MRIYFEVIQSGEDRFYIRDIGYYTLLGFNRDYFFFTYKEDADKVCEILNREENEANK